PPLRIGSVIETEEEIRGLEHRLGHQLRALDEVGLMAHQCLVALLLPGIERPAERLEAEFANETGPTGDRWLAWNQAVRITTPEGGASQFLRGAAVYLHQERRKTLCLRLVAESIDEIFRSKLVSGRGLVAEQVADSVVELAMGKPSQVHLQRPPSGAGG